MLVMILLVPLVYGEKGCISGFNCIDNFDRDDSSDLGTATCGNIWNETGEYSSYERNISIKDNALRFWV